MKPYLPFLAGRLLLSSLMAYAQLNSLDTLRRQELSSDSIRFAGQEEVVYDIRLKPTNLFEDDLLYTDSDSIKPRNDEKGITIRAYVTKDSPVKMKKIIYSPSLQPILIDVDSVSIPFKTLPEPLPIWQPEPIYPDSAKAAGIRGKAYISVFVGKNGRVLKSKVVKETPKDWGFGAAALYAAEQWRFVPALEKGKAKGAWVTLPFNFNSKKN
jgi:TonB family protein